MPAQVTFNGREVKNPILKWALTFLGLVMGLLGLVVAILVSGVGLVVLILVAVICLPLHPFMRLLGRQGFVKYTDGAFEFFVSGESFKRKNS